MKRKKLDRAYLDQTHSGTMRMVFRVDLPNGQGVRIREALPGVQWDGKTGTNYKFIEKGKLHDLNLALALDDWNKVRHLCPRNYDRLKHLGLLPPDARVTIQELLTDTLNEKKRRTNESVPRRHLMEYFGAMLASDCKRETIAQYRSARHAQVKTTGEKYSDGTIRLEMAILRHAFVLGFKSGKITTMPIFEGLMPPPSPARDKVCTEAELKAVLKYFPKQWHPVTWTAYYTAWRKGELTSRQRTDLTPEGVLHLDAAHSKNGQARMFPVSAFPQLIEVLKANEQRRADLKAELAHEHGRIVPIPTLFFADGGSRNPGGPLGGATGDFHHSWRVAVRRAVAAGEVTLAPGQKLVFHNMRHTANTNFRRSMDPVVAKRLTGHESDRVNDLYTHMEWRDMVAGVERHAQRLKEEAEKPRVFEDGKIVELFPAPTQPPQPADQAKISRKAKEIKGNLAACRSTGDTNSGN